MENSEHRTENQPSQAGSEREENNRRAVRFSLPALRSQKGFTLLLAALVASIALSLGSSIYSIASKELTLSSIGQDSQYAFYAADTAAECALYWDSRSDIHPNTFATSTGSQGTAASITCDGQPAQVAIMSASQSAATSSVGITSTLLGFDLFKDTSSGYCANMTVSKTLDQSGAEETVIIANGYSVSCASVATAPDALQRTVELTY